MKTTTLDRSSYKSTLITDLDQPKSNNSTGYTNTRNYLQLNPGLNKFRLYPVHPNGGGRKFIEQAEFFWIEVEADEYINNQKTGAKVIKKKRVFDALTHSSYLKKDPIREYVKFAEKTIKATIEDEALRNEKLTHLVHYQFGLKPQKVYFVYAQRIVNGKLDEFGILELKPSLKQRLEQISSVQGADDVMGTEPFTDINTGDPIVITYNKGGDPKLTYSLELVNNKNGVSFPLSDSDLLFFESKESLYSLYRNVYKKRDFYLAVAGLERFDLKNQLGIMNNIDFRNILEEISNSIKEDVVEDKPTAQTYTHGNDGVALGTEAGFSGDKATTNTFVGAGSGVSYPSGNTSGVTPGYANGTGGRITTQPTPQVVQQQSAIQPSQQFDQPVTQQVNVGQQSIQDKLAALKANMNKGK